MGSDNLSQLSKNLRLNIASFVCNVVIGLWLVPYLVNQLGVSAYGLVPLAMVFTGYVGLITQSFNSAVTRFLTVELRGAHKEHPGIVFNSSIILMISLLLMQVLLIVPVLFYLERLIVIPDGLLKEATWLFALTFAGFILSMLGGVFSVAMYSNNRLDLMRFRDMAQMFIRIFIIVLFFSLDSPRLFYIGVGNLLGGGCALFFSVFFWRQLSPELIIDFRQVESAWIKAIAGMAGWIIINTVGYLLCLRIDLYVVNRFIGAEAAGEYAAVLQWSQLLRTGAAVLSGVITPLGMIYYAQGEIEKLTRMMKLAVKLISLILALPLALLCAFSSDILGLWLGENFRSLGALMSLMLCTLVFNLGVLPLFSINVAMNRVKVPALLTLIIGGLNFLMAVFFVEKLGWGYYGVVVAGVLALTLKNVLFTPIYAAYLLKIKKLTFLHPLIGGFMGYLLLYLGATYVRALVHVESFVGVILLIILLFLVSVLPLVWWGLAKDERSLVAEMTPNSIRSGIKKILLVSVD